MQSCTPGIVVNCMVGSCLHQKVPLTELGTAQELEMKRASPVKLTYPGRDIL